MFNMYQKCIYFIFPAIQVLMLGLMIWYIKLGASIRDILIVGALILWSIGCNIYSIVNEVRRK